MDTPNHTILLIDADSMLWASCFTKDEGAERSRDVHDLEEAIDNFDKKHHFLVNTIEEQYGEHFSIVQSVFFIEGPGNFRKSIDKGYKSSRKKRDIPKMLNPLKKWVKDHYGNQVFISYNVETDDSIRATYRKWYGQGYDLIIASSDKDIKTIPCVVFDYYFGRNELSVISEEEASKNFWTQMLTGDSGDDVKGVEGIGPKKAVKLLSGATTPYGLFRAVYAAYLSRYGKVKGRVNFVTNYRLLNLLGSNIYTPDINEVMF